MPPFETDVVTLALVALAAYGLGAIPFGLVITRAMGLGDLRRIGSGNIGATNVLRTGSKPAALATLVLDAGKGVVAVLVARAFLGEEAAQIAGLAAFLGHLFSVWIRFRGGKGVATLLGILLALHWPMGGLACAIWLGAARFWRISSLAALAAAVASPPLALLTGYAEGAALIIALMLLVVLRHRENITRLRAGTEPRIGNRPPTPDHRI